MKNLIKIIERNINGHEYKAYLFKDKNNRFKTVIRTIDNEIERYGTGLYNFYQSNLFNYQHFYECDKEDEKRVEEKIEFFNAIAREFKLPETFKKYSIEQIKQYSLHGFRVCEEDEYKLRDIKFPNWFFISHDNKVNIYRDNEITEEDYVFLKDANVRFTLSLDDSHDYYSKNGNWERGEKEEAFLKEILPGFKKMTNKAIY